jgi:outer membrane protein assembly factor BamB
MRRIAVAICALFLAALIFFPGPRTAHAQVASTPWPMFHHDLLHTGRSQYDTSSNKGTLRWVGNAYGSPVIGADGTIYATNGALNPDGSQKAGWSGDFGGLESSPLIGADGTVYAGLGAVDQVVAVNPDGTQKWTYGSGTVFGSLAVGGDGTIYFGAQEITLTALNADGTFKWFASIGEEGGAGSFTSPAINGGTIYVVDTDAVLHAISSDGIESCSFTAPPFDMAGDRPADYYSSPAIGADGTIYFGDFTTSIGTLYAVNPDCSEKWAFATGGAVQSTPAIGADGTIYVGSEDDNLYAVNPDGTQKWVFPTGGFVDSSPAIGADGGIYFGSIDGNLYALNPDGTLRWSLPIGSCRTPDGEGCSPAIGIDGTVYIGGGPNADNNQLYAVGGPPTTISVPASLALGNSPVGDKITKNLTVKNTGKTNPLFVSVTSSDAEFAATSAGTCGTAGIAPLTSCTIAIGFTPNGLGARSATLTINDNTATSPQHVALSGTGTVDMTVTPTSYGFGSVKDGSKAVKAIVVHNYQTNPVSLGEGFTGPNAVDLTITGGTCGSTLAKTSACSLIVTFAPTATGTESATMTVTDGPDPLGPYTVTFTALATVPESLSPAKLVFGNVDETASKTLNLTVSNKATSGSITLTGTNIGGANAGDFAVTGGTCGASLAASSSCTYAVTFTPSTETAEAGTVSVGVMEDPNGGPPAVPLTGSGLAPLRVTPASSAFGTVANGKSSTARTITVTNLGGAAISLSDGISGTNAGDFAVTGGTCGAALAGGTSCTYLLKFTPSIDGTESATLAVSGAGDASSPHNVSLSGTGSGPLAAPSGIATLVSSGGGTISAGATLFAGSFTITNTSAGVIGADVLVFQPDSSGGFLGAVTEADVTCTTCPGGPISVGSALGDPIGGISIGLGLSPGETETLSLSLTFSPAYVGPSSGTLELDGVNLHNDSGNALATLSPTDPFLLAAFN